MDHTKTNVLWTLPIASSAQHLHARNQPDTLIGIKVTNTDALIWPQGLAAGWVLASPSCGHLLQLLRRDAGCRNQRPHHQSIENTDRNKLSLLTTSSTNQKYATLKYIVFDHSRLNYFSFVAALYNVITLTHGGED